MAQRYISMAMTETKMRIDAQALAANFTTYKAEVATALETVESLLSQQRFAEASAAMTTLTQRQAKTSTAMRAVLIRAGYIKEED